MNEHDVMARGHCPACDFETVEMPAHQASALIIAHIEAVHEAADPDGVSRDQFEKLITPPRLELPASLRLELDSDSVNRP